MDDAIRNLGSFLLALRDHKSVVCGCCGVTVPCRCDVEYIGPFVDKLSPHVRNYGEVCDYRHRLAVFWNPEPRALLCLVGLNVVVTGGRDFNDWSLLSTAMDNLNSTTKVSMLAHGGATGADALAKEWATRRSIPVAEFKADWASHGKRAGPLRNLKMVTEFKPDLVVAFSGGRGTADCVRVARSAKVLVLSVKTGLEDWRDLWDSRRPLAEVLAERTQEPPST